MNIIRFWWQNARPISLPQSLLPAVLALCTGTQAQGFSVTSDLWLGLLAAVGVVFAHLSLNLFDDYFDYKIKRSDFRDRMVHKGFRARIAKCTYLTSEQATLRQLLIACIVLGAIAVTLGTIIWWFRGNFILWITGITALLGISYSGAPLRLSYHGLGEILIGIIFGPLSMIGVYYAVCGQFDNSIVFISVPIGLLVMDIVYVHAIMDYEPDKEVGKSTLAVALKSKNLMLAVLLLILVLSYASMIGGVIFGYLSVWYLLTLLTFPMACALFYLMLEFVRHPEKKYTPQWWMGNMGNWKGYQAAGLDWFMIRWLLARNLLSFFCLLIIIVCFI